MNRQISDRVARHGLACHTYARQHSQGWRLRWMGLADAPPPKQETLAARSGAAADTPSSQSSDEKKEKRNEENLLDEHDVEPQSKTGNSTVAIRIISRSILGSIVFTVSVSSQFQGFKLLTVNTVQKRAKQISMH